MSKKYTLKPEHEAQLESWTSKWIKNAMSTRPMDEEDKTAMRKAVKGLYESAGLKVPPDERIIFVPSPFVLRFAAGFASAIWWKKWNNAATANATARATDNATYNAIDNATINATYNATYHATYHATASATDNATARATDNATDDATARATASATDDATINATSNATINATASATYHATRNATRTQWFNLDVSSMQKLAHVLDVGTFGLQCAVRVYYNMWQGGNQWSAWVCFLSFFRHVAKLPLDYSKYDHWEKAAIHGGPRVMHPEFCMISDRPSKLLVDDQNRPHCDTGPFCEWSDGTALYAVHGVHVPMWIVNTPASQMDVNEIMALENVEQRLIAIRKFGAGNMLKQLNGKSISKKGLEYELWEVTLEGEKNKLLAMQNPSEPKVHYEWVPPEINTVTEAMAWRVGIKIYKDPVAKS